MIEVITAAVYNHIARKRNAHGGKPHYSYAQLIAVAKAAELEYRNKQNGKINE